MQLGILSCAYFILSRTSESTLQESREYLRHIMTSPHISSPLLDPKFDTKFTSVDKADYCLVDIHDESVTKEKDKRRKQAEVWQLRFNVLHNIVHCTSSDMTISTRRKIIYRAFEKIEQ